MVTGGGGGHDVVAMVDDIVFDDDLASEHAVGIDPGAIHCGVALWRKPGDADAGWTCEWAVEMNPDECVDFVRELVRRAHADVFIEGFWLKPGKAALQQAGSSMETVEVIGVVRHLYRWHGTGTFAKVANGQQSIETRLKAAGYKFVSHGFGGHAKDAECIVVNGLGLRVRDIQQIKERQA